MRIGDEAHLIIEEDDVLGIVDRGRRPRTTTEAIVDELPEEEWRHQPAGRLSGDS